VEVPLSEERSVFFSAEAFAADNSELFSLISTVALIAGSIRTIDGDSFVLHSPSFCFPEIEEMQTPPAGDFLTGSVDLRTFGVVVFFANLEPPTLVAIGFG